MGSLLWILKATPKVTMKLLCFALLVASTSAFDLSKLRLAAPPTEIEYGFCDGSPEPASIDNINVEPFPILVQNGASVTLAVQITLNEPLPAGASVSLNLVLEGIIPIKIPCLDIDGLSLGSCTYTGDHLLEAAQPTSPTARPAPSPSTLASMVAATPSSSAPLSPSLTSSSPS